PGGITDINVTPFVDVVLVLLVVFIVTAKLIVARGIEIEKAKAETGGDKATQLKITITADGAIYVNGDKYANDEATVAKIKDIASQKPKSNALVSGDRRAAYGGVMHAIDLVKK